MSVQIDTDNGVFKYATKYSIQEKIFELANGTLVVFYIKNFNAYYSISDDDGATWNTGISMTSGARSIDVYHDTTNDDFYCATASQGESAKAIFLDYNGDDTWTKSNGTIWSSVNAYYCQLVKRSDGRWFFGSIGTNGVLTLFYSDTFISGGWSVGSSPSSSYTDYRGMSMVAYQTNIMLITKEKYWISSGNAFTGNGTTIGSDTLDTTLTNVDVLKLSDNEIYAAFATDNGIVSYVWNGSAWSSSATISTDSGDYSPSLGEISGKVVCVFGRDDATDHRLLYSIKDTAHSWGSEAYLTSTGEDNQWPNLIKSNTGVLADYIFTKSDDEIYYDSFEVAVGETINIDETLELSDTHELNVPEETIDVDESITLSDDNELDNNAIDIQESLTISDALETEINRIDVEDGLTLSDSLTTQLNRIDVEDSLTLSDTLELSNQGSVEYASKILSRNPLLIAIDSNPAKIAEIDITDPDNPTWSVYTIVGCSNANNITYNSETGYLYVFCDNGQLSKILATNLNSQTLIDTLDADNLELSAILEDKFINYAVTNDANGEIITIDESTLKNVSIDIRFLKQTNTNVTLQINTNNSSIIDTDIRFLASNTSFIPLDIRFLKYAYSEVSQNPITYNDWQVKINGTDLCPLNDVDLKSINITHTDSQQSTATFILHRKFDDLDRDHDGNASEITNNNTVQIYINGVLEFDGKVSEINPESESEYIALTALADEKTDNRQTKNIPLASVNESLHLYHCLTQSFTIEKPYIDSAAYELDKVYGSGNTDLKLIDPPYYKGVKYDRGTRIIQRVNRYSSYSNVATDIINGSFVPKQNWSYFWTASLKYLSNASVFGSVSTTSSRYIGSSLSPISSDVIELLSAYYKYQRVYENTETSLGYSYLGEAPYQEVSGPNGALNPVERWEDRDDGLYNVRDDYYNNLNIIYKIAQLEYQKLKNIHGNITPVTRGTITLTLDGYYYYDLSLLTRINITNTTVNGTYKDNNGFPVAIKSITITSADMKVSLEVDNQLSQKELNEIDADYPDDDSGQYDGYANKVYSKYDILSRTYIA